MLARRSLSLMAIAMLIFTSLVSADIFCFEKGSCSPCKKDDFAADYCKPTRRMICIICNDGDHQYEEFRACPLTAEDEQIRVIIFQVVMCIVGGLTYWAAQRRKVNTMSLFDSRKLRR